LIDQITIGAGRDTLHKQTGETGANWSMHASDEQLI
jgi:hypothetical protein